MPSVHARFSPSAANRRIHCPPSLLLEEQFEEGESTYAAEGTAGHELAEHLIRKYLKLRTKRPTSEYYTDELLSAVNEYVSFVIGEIETARRKCKQPVIVVEQRVDASEYVDNCFGTADMVIITDKTAHVIDLKLGKGVEVHAEENPQLMIYGLGVLHMAESLYDIETVRMTIFQPRLYNVSSWEVEPEYLKRWGEEVLRPAGAQAMIGAGEFAAGSWCRFCKARNQCRARAEHFLDMAKLDFKQPALLSDEEIADIISKADELSKWASDIYAFAQEQAISFGKHWPGYKVVEGRSNRKFTSDEEVIQAAEAAGYSGIKRTLNSSMELDFSPTTAAELGAYVAEITTAIKNGEDVSPEDLENLQKIMDFVAQLNEMGVGSNVTAAISDSLNDAGFATTIDTIVPLLEGVIEDAKGVGEDAGAGVGEGMAAADLTPYAQTVASNADTALRSSGAFDSASPANSTKPVGKDAALGIGEGMAAADLSSYADTTASNARSSLSAQLSALSMKRIGTNAMAGLVLGILSGRAAVVTAMKLAARSAVNAAKSELKIASPSRVFRDEVGAMTMEGFGEGVLESTKEQAKVIRNASRYLTGEAKDGTIATGSTDNRRTYNNNVHSTVQVAQMVVRDEQDIRSLAVEIASLSRRQQRGRGLRMA